MYLIAQCRGRVWVETINVLFQLLHRRRPYNRATDFLMEIVYPKIFLKGNMEKSTGLKTYMCQYDC